jgi:succinyl-diaminopimelate desuccinylase
MVVGMSTLARAGVRPPGDVHLLATVGEEVDCAGARAARDSGATEGVGNLVIAEPTDLDLVVAHKGALFLEFVTEGRAAHGAMPEQGVNAITHMMALLDRLGALDLGGAAHPLLGSATLSIGTVHGGSVVNIVPDRCSAQVDVRTVPGIDHAVLLARIEGVIAELRATRPGFAAHVRATGDYPAGGTDTGAPLGRAAGSVLEGVLGRPPRVSGVSYFSDGSILQPGADLPTLLFGPGDPNLAHQTDERVHVAALERAAEFYALLPSAIVDAAAAIAR